MKRSPIRKRRGTRRGLLRDEHHRRWIAQHSCCICYQPALGERSHEAQSQAAHIENNGTSSKGPDSLTVPFCYRHHQIIRRNQIVSLAHDTE